MLLWYGRWLRRQRRAAESRAPLRAARDGFDALGSAKLAEIARQELRATGETSRRRVPETWDQLTPHELQIAALAAEGLSNREIGQQLFISHRTVGYHLHRIFPKLDITSRSQLHAALLSLTSASRPTAD
jgi:DNA-binding NarL/FixJ family response regulator